MQVIYCGCFCLFQCRFSLFYIIFRLLSSASFVTAFNIIHFLATFTETSIVRALLFFSYFELLPLATWLFSAPLVPKNPFWSSPTPLDSVRILSLLFPQKSSVLSWLLVLLLCSQCLWFCSHVSISVYMCPFFMWGSTCAFTFHDGWSPKDSELEPVTLSAPWDYLYGCTLRYNWHVILSSI